MQGRGVIFDMDGVLVDSRAPHLRSWLRLANELGLSMTEAEFDACFGRTSREIIMDRFGATDPDLIREYDDRKEAIYRELIRDNLPVMPGAVELVRQLHEDGCLLAVGSSGPPENVNLVCEQMGLDRYLAAKITGADVERGKPAPQVFLLAAKAIRLDPQRCVVVEDAPAGIEAARRAGMSCIALTSSHPAQALSDAGLIVGALSQITPETIRQLS